MNVDDTQLLENTENNNTNGVTDTLVLKEASNKDDLIKETEILDKNSIANKKAELSNYCLKLVAPEKNGQTETFLLPLFQGMNKIGRSNNSDICILEKNVSKNHINIELNESPVGELVTCTLTDNGALNRTKVENDTVLNKNESLPLKLNITFSIGLTNFKFVKMTDLERVEQKENRTNILDLLSSKTKLNGSAVTNGKLTNLFEIQNTLDDTALIETTNSSDPNQTHDNDKFYVADTDPEDEDQDDSIDMSSSIHLQLQETINQSAYSNKTSTSLYIPDTMDYSYEDGGDDKANESMPPPAVPSVKTNGQAVNGDAVDKEKTGAVSESKNEVNVVNEKESGEPQTDTVELEKTKVDNGEAKSNGKFNSHTEENEDKEEESTAKENGVVNVSVESKCVEEEKAIESSPNEHEADTQQIVEKEASVEVAEKPQDADKKVVRVESIPDKTEIGVVESQSSERSEPKEPVALESSEGEKIVEEPTIDKRESILSNKSEAREDPVAVDDEEKMDTNDSDETHISENDIIPETPSGSQQQPQAAEETAVSAAVMPEIVEEKIVEEAEMEPVVEEVLDEVKKVKEPVVVEQKKTEKVEEPVETKPSVPVVEEQIKPLESQETETALIEKVVEQNLTEEALGEELAVETAQKSVSPKKSQSTDKVLPEEQVIETAPESVSPKKSSPLKAKSPVAEKQKPATDDIMVESTMFDPSQAKYIDQSQPLNSDDYPESEEEDELQQEPEEEKTLPVKSRGRPARGAAAKKEIDQKAEIETPSAPTVRRRASTRAAATPKTTPIPSTTVKSTRGRKKQSLEPQAEESVEDQTKDTESVKDNNSSPEQAEEETPAETKAPAGKRGRGRKAVETETVEPVKTEAMMAEPEAEMEVVKKAEPAKRGRRKTIVAEDVPTTAEVTAEPEDEPKVIKKAEPAKRGRRKTIVTEDAPENQPEAEEEAKEAVESTESAVVTKKAEPAKRGRRKTVVNSEDIAEAQKEAPFEEEHVNEAVESKVESEVKKTEPAKRGRRNTATVSTEDVKAAEASAFVDSSENVEAESMKEIKEVEEEKEVVKAEPVKRGRKKATVTVNPEDVAAATPTTATTTKAEEPASAPAKPTLGRRASLRTRPAAAVSTPKEPTVKKTAVKTIEESPIKPPTKAKVTRRNSVAVASAAKTRRGKGVEAESANVETEEEKEPVAAEPEKESKKAIKKEPAAKGRRQTIAVVTEDVTEATTTAAKKAGKSPKIAKKVDTYSYDDSDKSGPESEIAKKKNLKKKRNQVEMEADEVETSKKLKAGNRKSLAQTESDSDQETLATKKKRAQKRKSDGNGNTDEAVSTPKLFFHSKRVKTTPPTNGEANKPSDMKTVYSPFVNTPSKACNLNTSSINGNNNFNGSMSESPSKKFKLFSKNMKSSSSSENLNSSDEKETTKKEDPKPKASKLNKSGLKSSLVTNSPNDTVNKSTGSKHVSIKLPNEKDAKKVNGKATAAAADLLNKTTDNIEIKPKAKPVKSARHSLGNIRGSSGVPKIMTTGIMLTEKEKKIIENLGGEIVTDVRECTHLITNKIRKTFKFLSCLGRSVHIIGDRWLDESNKNKMFLNPITYSLNDKVTEKHYKFNLETSLLKSKTNPLLQDWTFLLKYEDSPDEELTFNNIKIIIECAGGKLWESLNNKLPKDAATLSKFCIIYENKERYAQDTKNADAKVSRIYLDTLLTCVLKQTFDNSCMIDQTAEAASTA